MGTREFRGRASVGDVSLRLQKDPDLVIALSCRTPSSVDCLDLLVNLLDLAFQVGYLGLERHAVLMVTLQDLLSSQFFEVSQRIDLVADRNSLIVV